MYITSVCAVCDTVTDAYTTCQRNQNDYCSAHFEHGFHGCIKEGVRDTSSSYAICDSCEAVVTLYFFCKECRKDYCVYHQGHEIHAKSGSNTSLSIEAIVERFGGPA